MSNNKKKNANTNKVCMIVLMYLIPFINILFLFQNYDDCNKIMVSICSVLSSTAAASACTIKAVKEDVENLFIAQVIALVLSVVSFFNCLIYDVNSGEMFLNEWIIFLFAIVANVAVIYMFVIAEKERRMLVNYYDSEKDRQEAKEMTKKASDRAKQTTANKMKVTKKGGDNHGTK